MSNEYDYSGLYNGQPRQPEQPQAAASGAVPDDASAAPAQPAQAAEQPAAPAQPAQAAGQPAAPAQSAQAAGQPAAPADAYPNAGSSGLNTANTARTDYTDQTPPHAQAQQAAQQPAGTGHAAPGGGYTAAPGTGYAAPGGSAYHSYAYTGAAPQRPAKAKKGKGRVKKVLLRVLAAVLVLALGFAGGFGGAVAASRLGLTGSQVVVNQIQRPEGESEAPKGSADGEGLSLAEVSAMVAPSVVVITTEQMVSSDYIWFGGSYVQSGAGSGVVMSDDGYILTCAHVVNGAQNVRVTLNTGAEYTATIVGADTNDDIAVLKIDATGLSPAYIGDSDALVVGESVIAVGNPLGMLGGTVTNGIVSAINREIQVEDNEMTLIQTNAAISPGNSGGGLFNANGELIGLVNAKSSSSDNRGNLTDAEGLGFAIPVNTVMNIARDLIDVGYVKRPVLGISVISIDDAQTAMQYGVDHFGVYIMQINPGSGAEKAGLQRGDRIIAVEDVAVSESNELTNYLNDCEVGDVIKLQIERDGRIIQVEVTLGVSQG